MSWNAFLTLICLGGLIPGLFSCSKSVETAHEEDDFVRRSMSEPVETPDGLKVKSFDLNQDLKPDIFKYYQKVQEADSGEWVTRIVRKELDLNYDGKIDAWMLYNNKGVVERERYDLDFDGKVDRTDYFGKGGLIKQEIDTVGDDKPDVVKYFLKGQVARKEKDRDGDGKPDYWEYFDNGRIERICEADPKDPEGVFCRQADQLPAAAQKEKAPESSTEDAGTDGEAAGDEPAQEPAQDAETQDEEE